MMSGSAAALRAMPARVVLAMVNFYRTWISPYRLPTCRFTPTCSEYATEAVQEHGAAKGVGLALIRLAKCGPWHRGGWDPVPERRHRHDEACENASTASDNVNRSS